MTLAGIITLVKPVQLLNAENPMVVTVLGMEIAPVLPAGHWMRVVWALL